MSGAGPSGLHEGMIMPEGSRTFVQGNSFLGEGTFRGAPEYTPNSGVNRTRVSFDMENKLKADAVAYVLHKSVGRNVTAVLLKDIMPMTQCFRPEVERIVYEFPDHLLTPTSDNLAGNAITWSKRQFGTTLDQFSASIEFDTSLMGQEQGRLVVRNQMKSMQRATYNTLCHLVIETLLSVDDHLIALSTRRAANINRDLAKKMATNTAVLMFGCLQKHPSYIASIVARVRNLMVPYNMEPDTIILPSDVITYLAARPENKIFMINGHTSSIEAGNPEANVISGLRCVRYDGAGRRDDGSIAQDLESGFMFGEHVSLESRRFGSITNAAKADNRGVVIPSTSGPRFVAYGDYVSFPKLYKQSTNGTRTAADRSFLGYGEVWQYLMDVFGDKATLVQYLAHFFSWMVTATVGGGVWVAIHAELAAAATFAAADVGNAGVMWNGGSIFRTHFGVGAGAAVAAPGAAGNWAAGGGPLTGLNAIELRAVMAKVHTFLHQLTTAPMAPAAALAAMGGDAGTIGEALRAGAGDIGDPLVLAMEQKGVTKWNGMIVNGNGAAVMGGAAQDKPSNAMDVAYVEALTGHGEALIDNFVLHRQFIYCTTSSAIIVASGSQMGESLWAIPDVLTGANAGNKQGMVNFTVYLGAIINRPWAVVPIRNCFIKAINSGYNGTVSNKGDGTGVDNKGSIYVTAYRYRGGASKMHGLNSNDAAVNIAGIPDHAATFGLLNSKPPITVDSPWSSGYITSYSYPGDYSYMPAGAGMATDRFVKVNGNSHMSDIYDPRILRDAVYAPSGTHGVGMVF